MSKVVPLPPLGNAVQHLEQDFAASTVGGGGVSKVAQTPPINHRPRAAVMGSGGGHHYHAKGPSPISTKRRSKKERKVLAEKNLGLEKKWNHALHIPFADGSSPAPRKGRISTTSPRRAATVPPMMHYHDRTDTTSPTKGGGYPSYHNGVGNALHGSFMQSPMVGNGIAGNPSQQSVVGFSPMMAATMSTTTSTPLYPQNNAGGLTPAAAQGLAAAGGGGRSYTEDELRMIVREEKERATQQLLASEAQKEKRLQYEFEAELQKERQRVLERQRELDWEREKARMREVERERELTRQQMLDRELDQARERARQAEREREKADRWAREQEREREKQLEQERELERQQERDAERDRETRRERERRDFIHHTERQALEDAERHERAGITAQADGIYDVLRSMHQQQMAAQRASASTTATAGAAVMHPPPAPVFDYRNLPPYFHHLFVHTPVPAPTMPHQSLHIHHTPPETTPTTTHVAASPTRESAGVQTEVEKHSVGTAPITPPKASSETQTLGGSEATTTTTTTATSSATTPQAEASRSNHPHNSAHHTTSAMTGITASTSIDEAFITTPSETIAHPSSPAVRKVDAAVSPRKPQEDDHHNHHNIEEAHPHNNVIVAPIVLRAESAMQTDDEIPQHIHHTHVTSPSPATPVPTPPLQHSRTVSATIRHNDGPTEDAASQPDRASVVVTPASGSRSQIGLSEGPPRPGSESGERVRRPASRGLESRQRRPPTSQSQTSKISDEKSKKSREQFKEKPSTGTVCHALTDLQFLGLGRVFNTSALDAVMRVATGEDRPSLPRRAGPPASRVAEAASIEHRRAVEAQVDPSVHSAVAASERVGGDAYHNSQMIGASMLLGGTMSGTVGGRAPLMFRASNETVLPPQGSFVMVDRSFYKDIQEPPRPAPPASQLQLDRQAALRRVQMPDPLCRAALPDVDVPDPTFDFERHPHNRDSFVSNLLLNAHKHVPSDFEYLTEDMPIY